MNKYEMRNQVREDEDEEYRKKIFDISLRKKIREQKLRDQFRRPVEYLRENGR